MAVSIWFAGEILSVSATAESFLIKPLSFLLGQHVLDIKTSTVQHCAQHPVHVRHHGSEGLVGIAHETNKRCRNPVSDSLLYASCCRTLLGAFRV